MAEAKGETHGCIVCGKLYQLYVVHDSEGKYLGSKVMSAGGKEVPGYNRPLTRLGSLPTGFTAGQARKRKNKR